MRLPFAALAALVLAVPAAAQTAADSAAVRASALDYAEGWYEGSTELVKRIVMWDSTTRRSVLSTMGASALVNATGHGYGAKTPKEKQEKDVRILDLYQNAGVVRITMADWVDFLQLAKVDGRWVIVNVLWERKPGHGT